VILTDTSVWVEHLRRGSTRLATLLQHGEVLTHPFIVGELACGSLKNRRELLRLLGDLPMAPMATDSEALAFIERHALMGRGIGYVDVHLLASAALSVGARLWTGDKRLALVASVLGLADR
jgi:predicted nucleic acid-binding protein